MENMDYNYEIYTQIENLKIIREWINDTDILLKKIEKMDINNIQKQIEEAYQRGLEEGKVQSKCGCWGCEYERKTGEHLPCDYCMNNFTNQWIAKNDKIEVGDEVKSLDDSGLEIKGFLPWVVTIADEDNEYC